MKFCFPFLLINLALCVWGQNPLPAHDWRQFRGPTGQGVAPSNNVPTVWSASENIGWKTELPGPGGSSPIVFGGHIYITSYTGYAVPGAAPSDIGELKRHLVCLNRKDGTPVWKKEVAAVQPEQAKVRDHGYASSTPAADNDHVYVFFGKSGVIAFNHEGGQKWHADVGSKIHGWGSASSPLLYKNLVIINAAVESGSLVALDKSTGKEVWRWEGMKESWNTPIIVRTAEGKAELVVAIMGKVLGFDPDTGKQLWSCATGIGWYMVPSLVSEKDIVYCIGGRTGGSLAVKIGGTGDVTQTHRIWSLNKGSNVPSPLFHDGHLYWFHEILGIFYCVKASTGNVVFEERLPNAGQFYGSPILVGETIYAFTRRGVGFVLAAKPAFEQIARNELGDRSSFDSSPSVDASRLLVRSDKFLYCIEKK